MKRCNSMQQKRSDSTPLMTDEEESMNNDFYNINQALDYTCSRLNIFNGNNNTLSYCGQCDRCQINLYIKECKQWFTRASHLTIKNFVLELIKTIRIKSIYSYLNNLLKISIDSKDFIYSRNKLIPSIQDDHLIVSNDRCLNLQSIDESINNVLQWYQNSNHYIKLNFMISLLKECEHAIIYMAMLQIKTILEVPRTISAMMNEGGTCTPNSFVTPSATKITPRNSTSGTFNNQLNRSSGVFTATSDYDDEIINDNTDDESFNGEFDISALYANVRLVRKAKHVDFIR